MERFSDFGVKLGRNGEEMKHPVAVAILSGFTDALTQEVENSNMAVATAKQVVTFALAIAVERLKGNKVFKEGLTDFYPEGEKIESLLVANKVHLQKFGDS